MTGHPPAGHSVETEQIGRLAGLVLSLQGERSRHFNIEAAFPIAFTQDNHMSNANRGDGAEAVGAYKDPKHGGGSSLLPWLLGLLALLAVVLLLLWLFGAFGGDDDNGVDVDDDDQTITQPYDDDADNLGEDDPGDIDTDEGFTPPGEATE